MNNLGAALLQKQKQTAVSSVDLGAIQQKINAERQGFIDTINALKAENQSLKAENDSLKAENDTLKAENDSLKAENDSLKAENDTLKAENESLKAHNESLKTEPVKTPEVKFVFM